MGYKKRLKNLDKKIRIAKKINGGDILVHYLNIERDELIKEHENKKDYIKLPSPQKGHSYLFASKGVSIVIICER